MDNKEKWELIKKKLKEKVLIFAAERRKITRWDAEEGWKKFGDEWEKYIWGERIISFKNEKGTKV